MRNNPRVNELVEQLVGRPAVRDELDEVLPLVADTAPLFPEVRSHSEDAFGLAQEAALHVITRCRGASANLRTQLGRVARRAGVTLWDKPFVNMRASCATESAQKYPSYVVTKWPGHTEAVAEAHYWQVTEDHFKKAVQQPPATSGKEQTPDGYAGGKEEKPQWVAASCERVLFVQYTRQESNL